MAKTSLHGKKRSPSGSQLASGPPRIEYLTVKNYRALRSIDLHAITPLTVLLGPNGSGKSTVFDVFNFLSECFTTGLRGAWDRRGRFRELRTRGATGPIEIELGYKETPEAQLAKYRLHIDETTSGPVVTKEELLWRRVQAGAGAPYKILSYAKGRGWVNPGEQPKASDKRVSEELDEPDALAVSTLGRLKSNPRVAALRRFISDWYVSYLSIAETRGLPEAGAQERLSKTGDNLANVVQYLKDRHPEHLDHIFDMLKMRVPRLEHVVSDPTADGRLMLRIKDAPFDEPVLARFASDGTLKMLAYLVVLYDPSPPQFIGIEEPENFLHPRLLDGLGEECRAASERSQLLVTTHSPFLLNVMRPEEVRVLYRDDNGFTQAIRVSDQPHIAELLAEGGRLGHLWMEGYLNAGDPFSRGGAPRNARRSG